MPASAPSDKAWRDKIAPAVVSLATAQPEIEFFVFLSEQADLSAAADLDTKLDKGRYVYETLTEVANRTQVPVIAAVRESGAAYKSFWVANMVWVRGDGRTLERMARRSDVSYIHANPAGRLGEPQPDQPLPDDRGESPEAGMGIEWNISLVNAPAVWAAGVTGVGAVIGGIDSGYDWDHPAIINQYRGWNGATADHNYNWHDAIHSGGVNCIPDSPEPCDEGIHGTHTMGFMVGDDGGANQIGMAPGARWIGARCWEPVLRSHLDYVTECLQWMIAPTDLDGLNPDPAKAPHVVNNSWVCEPDEGCADPDILRPVIESVRAAGIVVLGGAGNNGPLCSSSIYPPSIYDAYFSVGATTDADTLASFSSRGPITIDGSGRRKPDVCAPGQDVRSCVPDGGYIYWSGTSFAGPHVAGLVALLISANPDLAGRVGLIESIIIQTVIQIPSTQSCGGIPGLQYPNNTVGYGRINAYAAYQLAMSVVIGAEEVSTPGRPFELLPNVPNPFNPSTVIRYQLLETSDVRLRVYDVGGRRIRDLWAAPSQTPGLYSVSWDGRDNSGRLVASGVYFCRLESDGYSQSQRMTLIK